MSPRAGEPFRIVPLVPNWSSPVRESLEFKTDIITSFDGKEQRRSVRRNPRRSFEFVADCWGRGKVMLDAFMAQSLSKPMSLLPDPTASTTLRSRMNPAGEDETTQDAILSEEISEARSGDYLIFDLGQGNMEALRIVGISGTDRNEVSLADVTETVMPAGTPVYLARKGYLREAPNTQRAVKNHASVRVGFDIDPGTGNPSLSSEGVVNLGWREAMMTKPNWSEGVELDYIWNRRPVDYGFGKTHNFVPINFPSRITKFQFLGKSQSEVRVLRDFFIRHMGRRKEFICPTWEDDVPYSYIAAGSRSILIDGAYFASTYSNSTVFKRIVIMMADGSYHHRQVDAVEYLEDTDTSVLRTRTDLPFVSLTPSTVFGISWGLISRFASDKMEINWLTSKVAEFALPIQTLENFDI